MRILSRGEGSSSGVLLLRLFYGGNKRSDGQEIYRTDIYHFPSTFLLPNPAQTLWCFASLLKALELSEFVWSTNLLYF